MARKISPQGIKFIEAQEGVVNYVYLDTAHILTAGVGHVLTVAERREFSLGDRVSQEQVDKWLERDIAIVEATVNNRVKADVSQNAFDALCSLCFNIGTQSFSASALVKKLNKSDYLGAAAEFLKWNHAGGKVLTGLTNRRKREATLFLTGTAATGTVTDNSKAVSKPITFSPPSEEKAGGDARNHPIEPPASVIPPTPSEAPTALPKTVPLPPSTGGTAQATKLAWQLPSVSVIFVTVISAIQSLVDHGYLKADEIGTKVFTFFLVNWQFIIYLAIAVISYLIVKKCLSYIPSILQFINHSDNSVQDVNFVPHGSLTANGEVR